MSLMPCRLSGEFESMDSSVLNIVGYRGYSVWTGAVDKQISVELRKGEAINGISYGTGFGYWLVSCNFLFVVFALRLEAKKNLFWAAFGHKNGIEANTTAGRHMRLALARHSVQIVGIQINWNEIIAQFRITVSSLSLKLTMRSSFGFQLLAAATSCKHCHLPFHR